MDIYELAVEMAGREVKLHMKPGVMGTMESGAWDGKKRTPKHKISAIIGINNAGPHAWIEVAEFAADKSMRILHQGWISKDQFSLESVSTLEAARASLKKIDNPTEEMKSCQANAQFGILDCCTSNGDGCYVTCCGSCCADPYGCPGASCCG